MKNLILAALVFLSIPVGYAQALSLTTIEVMNRPPEELAKVIKPLLSEQGTVQVYNNQLIIQETPERMPALQALIQKLDQKAERLRVTVSQGHDRPTEALSLTDPESGSSKTIMQTSREEDRTVHHLEMNSGETAYIESGLSIPVVMQDSYLSENWAASRQQSKIEQGSQKSFSAQVPTDQNIVVRSPTNSEVTTDSPIVSIPGITATDKSPALIETNPLEDGTINFNLQNQANQSVQNRQDQAAGNLGGAGQVYAQKTLKSGIYLTPTLRQGKVYLHIVTINEKPHEQYQDRPAKHQPSFYFQKMESTVTLPLGQWVMVGGNQRETELSNQKIISTRDRREDKASLWVRIDIITDGN